MKAEDLVNKYFYFETDPCALVVIKKYDSVAEVVLVEHLINFYQYLQVCITLTFLQNNFKEVTEEQAKVMLVLYGN